MNNLEIGDIVRIKDKCFISNRLKIFNSEIAVILSVAKHAFHKTYRIELTNKEIVNSLKNDRTDSTIYLHENDIIFICKRDSSILQNIDEISLILNI